MSGFYTVFYDDRDNELLQSPILAPVPCRGDTVTLPTGTYTVGWVEWQYVANRGGDQADTVSAAVFLYDRTPEP